MLEKIVLIAIGFSVVSAGLLMAVYSVIYKNLNKSKLSILSAILLLTIFAIVQILHLNYLNNYEVLFQKKYYLGLILLSAPAFYLFVREYINVINENSLSFLIHLVPVVFGLFLPNRWAIPFAFFIGSVYSFVCVYYLFELKKERKRFVFELFATVFFLVIALAVCMLGLLMPLIDLNYFMSGYSILIALSFVLVVATLLVFPDVALNLNEAVEQKYAKSSLENINQASVLNQLETLMQKEKIFCNENLNLSTLADQLSIKSYQLSELINTQYGYGFPRYLRQFRVEAAKERLLSHPKESILSISLSVGFNSQSSFYTSFKQFVGLSPANYRKQFATH